MNLHSSETDWMDGMKGIAIFTLVVYHWYYIYDAGFFSLLTRIGGQGVHIFFILSSFGLYLSLSKEKRPITRGWFKKRFIKVLVPYYMAIVLCSAMIILYAAWGADPVKTMGRLGLSWGSLMASVFLYRNFIEQYFCSINVAWGFVGTILQLYLVFPWLYHLYQNCDKVKFLCLTGGITLTYQFLYSIIWRIDGQVFSKFFLVFLFEFSLGLVLADMFLNYRAKFYRMISGFGPFFLGLILQSVGLAFALQGREGVAFNDVFNATGIFLIVYNVVVLIGKFEVLKKAFDWLGRNALGFFLLNQTFMLIVFDSFRDLSVWQNGILFVLYFLSMCFVTWLFQKYLIEQNPLLRPLLRFKPAAE